MDIKNNLAQNLVILRKQFNMTQAEFAQKLNYSDKAVSKWERGEAIPDLIVVKQIADIYGVTVDYLISEPKIKKPKTILNLNLKRGLIMCASAGLTWLVAVLCFTFIKLIAPTIANDVWLCFIIAIPVTFIVVLVLSAVWKNYITLFISISLLVWSTLLAIYICLITLLVNPHYTLWMLFLIGVPLQALEILFFWYKKISFKI